MKKLILTLLLFVPIVATAQIEWITDVDPSEIIDWVPDNPKAYQAGYHFGDSEWESQLILVFYNNHWYAQLNTGTWASDGKKWINHYENFENVKISGNSFYSDKSNGKFVMYISGKDTLFGLKIYDSWSGEEGQEIGAKICQLRDSFQGKYPQASFRTLRKTELQQLSKSELGLMRNEIFARYGYTFMPGGKMDDYFRKQLWYTPQHKDVTEFLTKLEKDNIALIQRIEKE